MTTNAGDKGEWAKAVVTAALLNVGLSVYRAVSPAASPQIVVASAVAVMTPIEVKCAQVRATKEGDRLVIVSRRTTDEGVLAVVTPDAHAWFDLTAIGERLRFDPVWTRLPRFSLDGSTIVRQWPPPDVEIGDDSVSVVGGWCPTPPAAYDPGGRG